MTDVRRTSAQRAFSNRTNSSNEEKNDESQHNSRKSFSLLKWMDPGLCLCGEMVEDTAVLTNDDFCRTDARLESVITSIMTDIHNGEKENYSLEQSSYNRFKTTSVSAFEKLHQLSKIKMNRVPLVCSSKWDIIPPLANGLHSNTAYLSIGSDGQNEDIIRRLICLTLINLSIPTENKNIMVHGPHSNLLLRSITAVINMMVPEATYLCCIVLMNLSLLQDTAGPILKYSPLFQSGSSAPPPADGDWYNSYTFQPVTQYHTILPRQRRSSSNWRCLDDPNSLIRSLERLIRDKQPFLMCKAFSVEGEGIRWAVGLLRYLTLTLEHCAIISKTEIPSLVLGILERTPHQTIKWTNDSTEDMTLKVLENLAVHQTSREVLKESGALVVLRSIQTGVGGEAVRDKISAIINLLQDE